MIRAIAFGPIHLAASTGATTVAIISYLIATGRNSQSKATTRVPSPAMFRVVIKALLDSQYTQKRPEWAPTTISNGAMERVHEIELRLEAPVGLGTDGVRPN